MILIRLLIGVLIFIGLGLAVAGVIYGVYRLIEYYQFKIKSPSGNRRTANDIVKLIDSGMPYEYSPNESLSYGWYPSGFMVEFTDVKSSKTKYDVGFTNYLEYRKFRKWYSTKNSAASDVTFSNMLRKYSEK